MLIARFEADVDISPQEVSMAHECAEKVWKEVNIRVTRSCLDSSFLSFSYSPCSKLWH